jgi:hypothetical protein
MIHMKHKLIFAGILAAVCLIALGFFAASKAVSFPAAIAPASIPGYAGIASDIFGTVPTGTTLALGTSAGTVNVANFYAANSPVNDGGDIVVKATGDYIIVYDPSNSSFWLAITGTPFAAWATVAEQDFLQTLDVSEADACKLSVTEGVIYSPGDPNDAMSFPLSFCSSGALGQ